MSNDILTAGPAVSLADFTGRELIVAQLRGRDAPTVLRELCAVLQRAARVPDLLPFYHAALNREFLSSTVIDHGLAFPHARVIGLPRLSFALGRSAEPLTWVPKDRLQVRLVFLCAVPATEASTALLLASGVARLAREPRCLNSLLGAGGASEMLDILRRIKLRPARPEAP